jgi:FkbM family methyltransferase
MKTMSNKIAPPANERFALYGFGATGKRIVDQLLDGDARLDFIIDQSKHGDSYRGVPVISPADIQAIDQLGTLNCLMGLHNHYVDIVALYNTLSSAGFKKVYSLVSCKEIGIEIALPNGYWLDANFRRQDYQAELETLSSILADDKSREILSATVKYRELGDIRDCPAPSLFDEYTPTDLPKYKGPLKLIDCGACTGVAIEKLQAAGYAIDSFVAFEPDLDNYEKLTRKDFRSTRATCLPLGVWSSNTQLRFNNAGTMGSAIDGSGDTVIQCVSVDSVLRNFVPNLIKFDVEGAEIEALLGLEKTIKSVRPNLCVSLYHTPAHLFEIPLLINSWGLNYKFYIRTHEFNTFGTVLYCLNQDLISNTF